MPFPKKPSPKTAPAPRLLPLEAYPNYLTEEERDNVDARLRADFASIPVEPGDYLDHQNDPWNLGADGVWTDLNGERRSTLYTPLVSLFGPFTRVVAANPAEPGTRVHVTTKAELPVGKTVYSAHEDGDRGTVVAHLSNGNVGIRWDAGGTSTAPAHFGYWVDVESEPTTDSADG